jgi:hypothetical protein
MGYCEPKWIGAYTYKAVMSYLISPPPAPVMNAELSQAEQPCLLIWGHIRNGELVLEPAFRVNTRPRMPRRPGPYSVDATAEDGSKLFSLSFVPQILKWGGSTRFGWQDRAVRRCEAARLQSVLGSVLAPSLHRFAGHREARWASGGMLVSI